MTADDILTLLRARHAGDQWAFFAELRCGTGFSKPSSEKRLDAWAMNLYPSKGWRRITYEIKATRQDFHHELRAPIKKWEGLNNSNEFFFVTPANLITDFSMLPDFCGLFEVENDALVKKVEAPYRNISPPTIEFMAAVARRGSDAEQRSFERMQRKREEKKQ